VGLAALGFGLTALVGRIGKAGFQPYDLQTATLVGIVLFAVFALLLRAPQGAARWKRAMEAIASYSYSLYLLHNTILLVVLERLAIDSTGVHAAVGIVLAHLCSWLLYLGFERHYRKVGAWLRPKFQRVLSPAKASTPVETTAALGGLAARQPQL
jgi:peptidoglycan/LPS O-acetylase OafA/YrhL